MAAEVREKKKKKKTIDVDTIHQVKLVDPVSYMIQWIPYPSPWKYSKYLAAAAYLQQTNSWLERLGSIVQCLQSIFNLGPFFFPRMTTWVHIMLGGYKGQWHGGAMITEKPWKNQFLFSHSCTGSSLIPTTFAVTHLNTSGQTADFVSQLCSWDVLLYSTKIVMNTQFFII